MHFFSKTIERNKRKLESLNSAAETEMEAANVLWCCRMQTAVHHGIVVRAAEAAPIIHCQLHNGPTI